MGSRRIAQRCPLRQCERLGLRLPSRKRGVKPRHYIDGGPILDRPERGHDVRRPREQKRLDETDPIISRGHVGESARAERRLTGAQQVGESSPARRSALGGLHAI